MRLFFALWPPEQIAKKLAMQASVLSQRYGGKATRQETIHLTLAFLGEVDETRLDDVIQAARTVHAAPFGLTVDWLGYWRHNRLLWAGCLSPAVELQKLTEALRASLRGSSIACDESHGFTPHLTLVRKIRDAEIPRDVPVKLPAFEPLSWVCEDFVLVHSRRALAESGYCRLAEFPLITAKESK